MYKDRRAPLPSLPPLRQDQQQRPRTIKELSVRALDDLYDETKPFKHYLRAAEKYRNDGRNCYSKGDLENAFIHLARVATLVLDKLPTHREYYTLLSAAQRTNLNSNGTEILEDLGDLKRRLSRRLEDWVRDHPHLAPPTAPMPEQDRDLGQITLLLQEASIEPTGKEYVEMGVQVEHNDKSMPPHLGYSLHFLLETLRSKKQPDDPIGEVVNVLAIDIFRKLLGMNNYVNMVSLVGDSDTELLFEFILYLLEKNHLPNMDLFDANRRVRRLMLKIAAKKPIVPKFMFITGVKIDRSYVGWGGFADVFRGEFRGSIVAAKLLRTNRHSDICREALTWKSLSHKFVLPFLGIYEVESQFFLVSPFMPNGNLSEWRRKLNRPIAEIQKCMLEVAEGMQYIHSEGIVHGDLRGTNILLDSDCHVKIADFGLTRHLEATLTHSTSFSPNFAAPELFGNWDDDFSDSEEDTKGMQRTHKTDVYAFGSLYYEIHFNAIPFEDLPYFQLMKQVARNRKRPDRLSEPLLSDKAWKLIRRCWRHEASRRPSMEEVLESMVAWDAA